MTSFQTRGYSMLGTQKFIDTAYDAALRQRIRDQLSPEVREKVGTYRDVEWYPAQHFIELLRGIALGAGTNEEKAREELIRAGHFIAGLAASTFLRLVMKVLTPTLFAKKIPSLWARDNQGGYFETDLSDAGNGKIVFRLREVEGYDYIGPVAVGWIDFAMQTMGKKVVERTISGWSLEKPGPAEIRIDLRWQR
jgi:hypothetical protein